MGNNRIVATIDLITQGGGNCEFLAVQNRSIGDLVTHSDRYFGDPGDL